MKNMMVSFLLAFSLFLNLTSCKSSTVQDTAQLDSLKQLRIKEVIVIEKKPPRTRQEILGAPIRVISDKQGNTYVADMMSNSIKVFHPSGNFAHLIGKRGQGPGEFSDIAALAFDKNGNLQALDNRNARLTTFEPSGKVVATQAVDLANIEYAREMRFFKDHLLLSYFKEKGPKFMVHEFDEKLQNNTDNFMDISSILKGRNLFVKEELRFSGGHFWVTDEEKLYYVPTIYEGEIKEYQKEQGNSQSGLPFRNFSAIPTRFVLNNSLMSSFLSAWYTRPTAILTRACALILWGVWTVVHVPLE